MSDPTLGFSVDTSGLEKGNQALDQTLDKSKKVEDQANKTSDALGKMGSKSGDGLSKTAQSADQLAASLVKASSESQRHLNVSQALDAIVSKTGASYTQANAALTAAIAGHKNAADATNSHGRALDALAGAAGGVVPPINSIAQAAAASGSSLGGLTSAISAGRLAFGGIAGAAAAAAVELVRTGDELNRQKERFSAITGSAKAGAESLDLIKRTANSTGVEFSSLASATEKAVQGIDKMSTSWPVISVGANKGADDLKRMQVVLGTLAEVMQSTGANAREEGQVFGALGDSIQKTGGLTADTFERIRDALPQVARAIASAFSVTDLNAFQKALETHPKSFQDLEEAIKRIKPAVDAGLNPEKLKTFDQATRDLGIQWNTLLETLAKQGAFDGVTKAIGNTAKEIEQLGKVMGGDFSDVGKSLRSTLEKNIQTPWTDTVKIVDDKSSIFGKSLDINIDAAVIKTLATLGQLPGQGAKSVADFVNATLPLLQSWGSQAISIADSVASSLASAASSASKSMSAAGGVGGVEGASMAAPQFGGVGFGGASGADTDFASQVGDGTLPAFATGGSFTVGGSGGTDSQLIQFMATPGEKVSIDTPAGSASSGGQTLGSLIAPDDSGGNASSDLMSAHFSDAIKTQTTTLSDRINSSRDAIVTAVNNASAKSVTAPAAASLTATAATPIASGASAVSPTISGGGGGGGGTLDNEPENSSFSTRQKPKADTSQSNTPAISAQQALALAQLGAGQSFGTAKAIRGFQGSVPVIGDTFKNPLTPINPASTVPINPQSMAPVQTYGAGKGSDDGVKQQTDTLKQSQDTGSKTVADQVKSNADATKAVGDKTNSSLNDLSKFSSDQLKSLDTVQQSTEDGTDATKADTEATTAGFADTSSGLGQVQTAATQTTEGVSQTTNAVSTGSSSIVDALGNAASSIAEAVSNAVSSAARGVSNATSSGVSGFGSDISSGSDSFDSGSNSGFDFAGAVADGTLPAFASGGQFTVSGSGGTDTEHVEFMATPGEVVTVTPPGGTPPPNPAPGSSSGAKSGMRAFADGGQFTVGDAMMPGFSGADAAVDLIAAHTNEALGKQTLSVKDSVAAGTAKVLSAISSSTSSIISAVNAVGASVSAASASSSSAARSIGASASSSNKAAGQNDPLLQYMAHKYFDNSPGSWVTANAKGGYPAGYVPPGASGGFAALMAGGNLAGFATGGSFEVGGSGGTDSQLVQFKATPGETVAITPPGKASDNGPIAPLIPLHNDNIPGSGAAPTLSMTPQTTSAVVGRVVPHGDPAGNPDRSARNVNIFVQAGVQADQFIRSRAEMQRAMR